MPGGGSHAPSCSFEATNCKQSNKAGFFPDGRQKSGGACMDVGSAPNMRCAVFGRRKPSAPVTVSWRTADMRKALRPGRWRRIVVQRTHGESNANTRLTNCLYCFFQYTNVKGQRSPSKGATAIRGFHLLFSPHSSSETLGQLRSVKELSLLWLYTTQLSTWCATYCSVYIRVLCWR